MNARELAYRMSGMCFVRTAAPASTSVMKELHLSVTNTWGNRTLATDSPEWKALREKVLTRDASTCRFCRHSSPRWMVVDHINGMADDNRLENLGVNCQMCDRVRHCGLAGIKGLLMLGTSSLPQVEIVKKTREYFKANRRIPKAIMIDPKAKQVTDMTLVDFANMLMEREWEDLPIGMMNYRGFFTGKFDRWQV